MGDIPMLPSQKGTSWTGSLKAASSLTIICVEGNGQGFWVCKSGPVEALCAVWLFLRRFLSLSVLLQEKSVHSRYTARSCPLRPWCSTRRLEKAGSVPRAPLTVSCRRSTRSSSRPMTVARGPGRQPGRNLTSEWPDGAPRCPPLPGCLFQYAGVSLLEAPACQTAG